MILVKIILYALGVWKLIELIELGRNCWSMLMYVRRDKEDKCILKKA